MIAMTFVFPSGLAEDAYIILRYARNIADGYGFVWNPGELPVWGSTSFLWTILLAGFGIVGVNLILAAQILNSVLASLLVLTIGWFSVKHLDASRTSVLISLMILSISLIVGHILTGFDVILFSYTVLLSFIFSYFSMHEESDTNRNQQFLGISLILTSISRPEGIIIAGATLFIVLLGRKMENLRARLVNTFLVYGSAMLVFLLATFLYFGSFVPNPLAIKSSGISLVEASLRRGIGFLTGGVALLVLVLCVVWLLNQNTERFWNQLLLLIPIVGVFGSYFFIIQYQNVLSRFQFPLLPILFVMMPGGIDILRNAAAKDVQLRFWKGESVFRNIIKLGLVIGLVGIVLLAQYGDTREMVPYIEGQDKAIAGVYLNQFSESGYSLVVTEAGMLPYFSEWRVIDAWGLNDPYIANEGLSYNYLTSNNPEVIQFHDEYSNMTSEWENSDDLWHVMTHTLWNFSVTENYTLAAIIIYRIEVGSTLTPGSYQWYFVRQGFADSSEIINGLSTLSDVEYAYRFTT